MTELFKLIRKHWLLIVGGLGLIIVALIVLNDFGPGNANPTESSTSASSSTGTTASSTTVPTTQPTPGATGNLDQNAAIAMGRYGLMPTKADGSIRPEESLTRAEFAVILAKVLPVGGNVPNSPSFNDVLPNHPQYSVIEAVKDFFGYEDTTSPTTSDPTGTTGSKPSFKPDQPIQRKEACLVLARALNLKTTSALADTIQLPSGDPLRQADDKPLTRQEAARLFYLLIDSRLPTPAPTFDIVGVH